VPRRDPTSPVEIAEVWSTADPAGWRHPVPCPSCKPPARVALAYRGHYHRQVWSKHGAKNGRLICSDFFSNVDTHREMLVGPLEAAGASVKTYFHTYQSGGDALLSQQRDDRLVRVLRPARYNFSNHLAGTRIRRDQDEDEHGDEQNLDSDVEDGLSSLIVDSIIKVLELVLQDKKSIDAVVLTRFDLKLREPITLANVRWNVTNAAHKEGEDSWKREKRLSDLFFILPIEHVEAFIQALRISATHPYHHKATGAGHWIYMPFIQIMRGDHTMLNIIDSHFGCSTLEPSQSPNFIAISRTCGPSFSHD